MIKNIQAGSYALIIGAMKCGTSSVFNYLKGHPQICPSIVKEPEFFSENQWHGIEVENYHDLWPSYNPAVHKYVLEASTGYTKYPWETNVPRNISGYSINPKFIYIVRNPFDRIVSHFNFTAQSNKKNNTSHLQNVQIVDSHYINISNYFMQLEQYRKYFPVTQILILDFDDLNNNPAVLLKKIFEFLDVDPDYFPEEFEIRNPTRIIESNLEKNLKQSKIGVYLNNIPGPLKKTGISLFRKLYPPEKRKLTDAEKDCIYHQLKESMAAFQQIYGFDASKWGFDN